MTNYPLAIGVLLLALQAPAVAEPNPFDAPSGAATPAPAVAVDSSCFKPKKLRGMCMYIADRTEDPNLPGRYVFRYQRKLFEAACVDPSIDTEEVIAAKVSAVWKQYEEKLVCDSIRFDVVQGSAIKYAVAMKFDEFIIDLAKWKVDFNKVDRFDKRTVLDYVEYQIERMKGTASEPILQNYHRILRDAGAKRASEL